MKNSVQGRESLKNECPSGLSDLRYWKPKSGSKDVLATVQREKKQ